MENDLFDAEALAALPLPRLRALACLLDVAIAARQAEARAALPLAMGLIEDEGTFSLVVSTEEDSA